MQKKKKKAENCFVYTINYIPRLKTLKIMRYSMINILHIHIRAEKGGWKRYGVQLLENGHVLFQVSITVK
jgi:hypothetical protein